METDGKDNLRAPLLRPSEDVAINFTQTSLINEKNTRKVKFRIRGIKCASCAVSIESAIGNMKGIESISVSPIQGQAVIRYRPEFINVSHLITIIYGSQCCKWQFLTITVSMVILYCSIMLNLNSWDWIRLDGSLLACEALSNLGCDLPWWFKLGLMWVISRFSKP